MEELSLYRCKIGLFVGIAYRCSRIKKTKKRLQLPLKKIKKLKKRKRNVISNYSFKKDQIQHPSRLGPLLLMLLISVLCLNGNSNSITYLSKVGITSSFHITDFNLTSEQNFGITSVMQPSKVCWQQSEKNDETICLKPYLRRLNKTTNRRPQIQFWENKYYWVNSTVSETFKRYFSWWPSLKEIIRYFIITIDNFSSDMIIIELLNYGKLNNANNGSEYNSFCLIPLMSADIIFITIFLGLGTCCYLLGNKGMHSLNGNPPKQKSGDALLTRGTLTLVKQRVDESVGYISIKNTLPYDGDWDITYKDAGTGFRAGDKYFITAYHVLKEKIEQLLNDICYMIPDSDLVSVFKVLNQHTETMMDTSMYQVSKVDVNKAVIKYVKQTATNIPMLLDILRAINNTEDIENFLTKSWSEKCVVDFIEHGRFYVDWKIAFGDEQIDIAVIKLIPIKPGQMYPGPLLLDDNYSADRSYYVVRYINGTTAHVVVDQDSQTFKGDEELNEHVQAALNWWTNETSLGNEFKDKYASCKHSHNEETGRVILKASKSFQHGASGSPIVYLFNNDGQPVVGTIYQRGLPEFYYHSLHSGNEICRLLKDITIDSEVCLFESGTTMKKLYQRLKEAGLVDLRRNIFSQPEQHDVLYFGEEETKEIRDRITRIETMICNNDGYHQRGVNPNINTLHTLICQSRRRLEFQTSQKCEASTFPYVRTGAFEKALEILRKKNILVILGNPGDGKSTLAYQLMKTLTEEGRDNPLRPLILCENRHFDDLILPNDALCVLIDDIFGSCGLEVAEFSFWNKRLGTLLSTFQHEKDSKNNILILTSRKDILNDCPMSIKESPVFSEQSIVDLSSEYHMTRETMRTLINVYLPESEGFIPLSDEELANIEQHSLKIGFPQCCKIASNHKALLLNKVQYFNNPSKFIQKELAKLEELLIKDCGQNEKNLKYYALLVLLLNPSYFNSDETTQREIDVFAYLKSEYGFEWKCKKGLKETILAMTGLYTKYDKDTAKFLFIHESIQTAVALYFGAAHTKQFLQFCNLKHFSLLVIDNNNSSRDGKSVSEGVIKVSEELMFTLAKIIIEHLQSEDESAFQYIADMQIWESQSFILSILIQDKLFMSRFDASGRSLLVYFVERGRTVATRMILQNYDNDDLSVKQINSALNAACAIGSEELFSLLSSKGGIPDIHCFMNTIKGRNLQILSLLGDEYSTLACEKISAKFYPFRLPTEITILHQACFEGNVEMVRFISSKFEKLSSICDGDGRTSLHVSCYDGHYDVSEYLVQKFPALLFQKYEGWLPIHEAAQSGNIDLFDLIERHMIENLHETSIQNYIEAAITDTSDTIFNAACLSGRKNMCLHIYNKYPFLLSMTGTNNPLTSLAWSGDISCFQEISKLVIKERKNLTTGQQNDLINLLKNTARKSVLHESFSMGQIQMCRFLINSYPYLIDIIDNNGWHAIHFAAQSGNIECLKLITCTLMKNKDNEQIGELMQNCFTNIGETILHISCRNGKTDLCQYIVDTYPGLIDVRRNDGWHAIHETAWSGNIECLKLMTNIMLKNLDHEQRTEFIQNCLTNDGETILHICCRNGKTDLCQYIVDTYPGLVDVRRNDGWHAIHSTASSGSIGCLELITNIVSKNKDHDQRTEFIQNCLTNDGETILHICCRNGKTDLCQYIVDTYPGLIDVKDNDGLHTIHETAWSGSIGCLELITNIVLKNKDHDQRTEFMMKCLANNGETILHICCRNGKTNLCQYIVDTYPGLVDVKDNDGWHAIHSTAWSGSTECLKLMTNIVLKNMDPEQRREFIQNCLTKKGGTILHICCCNGKTDLCQYIVDTYPGLVDVKNNDGLHTIHETAWSGSIECLKLMTNIMLKNLDHEQRTEYIQNCLTNDGETILHICCRNGKTDLCQYIVDTYPGLVDVKDNDGWHAIHSTALSGNIECLELITNIVLTNMDRDQKTKFIQNCFTNDEETILHICCRNGKTDLCQYIVDTYPCLINVRQNDGWHAIHNTAVSGSIECLNIVTNILLKDMDYEKRTKFMQNCLTKKGETILHISCRNGKTDLCQYIIDTYPDSIQVVDKNGWHVVPERVSSGDIECIKLVLMKQGRSKDRRCIIL